MVFIFRNRLIAVVLVISFTAGWIISDLYASFSEFDLQKPLSMFDLSGGKSSPADRIRDYNIKAFDDKVVIYLNDPYLAKFADTHSMEPVLDSKSTGIEITPKSSHEIKAGDVISYTSAGNDDVIIHRVAKTGYDSDGWYAIARGDNNPANDPEKVRFGHVKRILVGVLY